MNQSTIEPIIQLINQPLSQLYNYSMSNGANKEQGHVHDTRIWQLTIVLDIGNGTVLHGSTLHQSYTNWVQFVNISLYIYPLHFLIYSNHQSSSECVDKSKDFTIHWAFVRISEVEMTVKSCLRINMSKFGGTVWAISIHEILKRCEIVNRGNDVIPSEVILYAKKIQPQATELVRAGNL